MTVDRSLKKLHVSTEALTMQIGLVKSPLALVLFVLSFYGESSGGNGLIRNGFVYDCITGTIG